MISGDAMFRSWVVMLPWILFIAALMISSVPTFTWSSIRIRREWRLFALAGVALLGAALVTTPWITLLAMAALYLAMMPFSVASYGRVKRRRAIPAGHAPAGEPIPTAAGNAR
jgi:CDP-diacylglycerol--serine O-phosphatidyltransferase